MSWLLVSYSTSDDFGTPPPPFVAAVDNAGIDRINVTRPNIIIVLCDKKEDTGSCDDDDNAVKDDRFILLLECLYFQSAGWHVSLCSAPRQVCLPLSLQTDNKIMTLLAKNLALNVVLRSRVRPCHQGPIQSSFIGISLTRTGKGAWSMEPMRNSRHFLLSTIILYTTVDILIGIL